MGAWTFIDGIEQHKWEFVSLGISEDLRKVPAVADRLFPQLDVDDSAWTCVISSGRRATDMYENDRELLAAA